MIIDGKKIAEEIIELLAAERHMLPPVLCLGVLMGAEDAASASFVKIKERVAERLHVAVVRELINADSTTAQALQALAHLSSTCAGVIVQMPLPPQISLTDILAALPPEKDVDAITEEYQGPSSIFHRGRPLMRAPVAEAISEVFMRTNIVARGKRAIVVGAGKLVGAPAAALLKELGADVSVITRNEGSLLDLKDADIVVLGAGEPGLVRPEMLKEGVVLIDAGTSEQGSRLVGDADPRCAEAASVFTPVPGGIGPIAVAMIFKNLFALAKLPRV